MINGIPTTMENYIIWYYPRSNRWHRIDGPAIISRDSSRLIMYYVEGKLCRTNEQFQLLSGITDEEMAIMILKYGSCEPRNGI